MARVTITLDLSDAERQAMRCEEGGDGFSREVHDLKWGVMSKLRDALTAPEDQPKHCGGSGSVFLEPETLSGITDCPGCYEKYGEEPRSALIPPDHISHTPASTKDGE